MLCADRLPDEFPAPLKVQVPKIVRGVHIEQLKSNFDDVCGGSEAERSDSVTSRAEAVSGNRRSVRPWKFEDPNRGRYISVALHSVYVLMVHAFARPGTRFQMLYVEFDSFAFLAFETVHAAAKRININQYKRPVIFEEDFTGEIKKAHFFTRLSSNYSETKKFLFADEDNKIEFFCVWEYCLNVNFLDKMPLDFIV